MGFEQAKYTWALWQLRKTRLPIARQPPIKRSGPDAFDREHERQGHHLTRIERSLSVLGHVFHRFVDATKQFRDQIECRHTGVLLLKALGFQRGGPASSVQDPKQRR